MSRSIVLLLGAASLVAGCSVQIRDGQFACTDGRCPTGWYCHADQLCHPTPDLDPADASMDARLDAGADAGADAGTDAPVDTPTVTCSGEGSVCTRGDGPGLCCGGRCIDPNSDATNCGTCGNACGVGTPRCLAGDCVECLPGLDACNDSLACTDDVCSGAGTCVNTINCPPLVPTTQDCRSGVTCTADGCRFTYLPDGAMCMNAVAPARDRCANQHCFDTNSCGTASLVCCTTASPDCTVLDLCDHGC